MKLGFFYWFFIIALWVLFGVEAWLIQTSLSDITAFLVIYFLSGLQAVMTVLFFWNYLKDKKETEK